MYVRIGLWLCVKCKCFCVGFCEGAERAEFLDVVHLVVVGGDLCGQVCVFR